MKMVSVKYAYYTRIIRVLYVFRKYVEWRIFKIMRLHHASSCWNFSRFSQDSKFDIEQCSSVVSPSFVRIYDELIEFNHCTNWKIRVFWAKYAYFVIFNLKNGKNAGILVKNGKKNTHI